MNKLAKELDALIDDSNNKAAQLETKQIVVRNKKCDHIPKINSLKEQIAQCDEEMGKLEAKIDEYVNGAKERQMA